MAKEEYASGVFDLGSDALTGARQKMHITTEGKMVFETRTNIDSLADQNQAIRNEIVRSEKNSDMVKVASLPMTVYFDLKQRGILGDKTAMKRWLKSEEAAPFRTHWMTS
jgi:hypothetical protein